MLDDPGTAPAMRFLLDRVVEDRAAALRRLMSGDLPPQWRATMTSEATLRLDPQEMALVEKTLTGLEPEEDTRYRPVVVDVEVGADAYRASVDTVLARIRAGELQKAVVSRTVPVTSDIDLPAR